MSLLVVTGYISVIVFVVNADKEFSFRASGGGKSPGRTLHLRRAGSCVLYQVVENRQVVHYI